ncbi:MAG: hypothetical protein ACE5HT_00980 [Gemmatimonadales bacterium]
MIMANLQQRLAPSDVSLVLHVLSRGDPSRRRELERVAQEQGIDELLDAPDLLELLRDLPDVASPSPALFISVAVRRTLRLVGIEDRRLSDYVGSLLSEFGARARAYQISRHDDQVYRYITDIVADIEAGSGRRRFLLQAHLGNFSLWLTGVFPDHVTARVHRRGAPNMRYFEEMGMMGFKLASEHRLARDFDMVDIYSGAAECFAQIRVGLNKLSDELFFPNRSNPDRLMRQVVDEFRYPLD